jgi:hypothetical protein
MKLRILAALMCAAMLALGLAACGDDNKTSSTGAADSATSSSKPTVEIMTPASGSTIGGQLTAKVDLKNFEIDDKAVGMSAQDGKGHLHFSLDNGKYDRPKYSGANGDLAVKLGTDGKYSPAVAPEITYRNLPAGEHTLTVFAANNDHSDVGAKDSVKFTVKEGAPEISIVQPDEGTSTSGTVKARVSLKNFKIDAKNVGKAASDGRGHLHFSLDGGKYDSAKYSGANGKLAEQLGVDGKYSPSVTDSVTYKGIPKGKHTLTVFVANNDHSDTGAEATTTFTVK